LWEYGHVRLSFPHRVELENEAGPSNTSDKRKENKVQKSNVPNEAGVVNNEDQNVDSNLKERMIIVDLSPKNEKKKYIYIHRKLLVVRQNRVNEES